MSARRALITGITGQDGSFLAELLLEKGYEVTGLAHRPTGSSLGAADHLHDRIDLVQGDLLEPDSLTAAIAGIQPDELYHLAAPSFVPDSWRDPAQTFAAIAVATATLLLAARDHSPHTRAFVASSGAIFGSAPQSPQHEDTPCCPETPYAAAKLSAHQLTGLMRAHDGLFACSGILYNHESERRPDSFVARKVTRAAAQIKLGLTNELALGDITAVRDWSFAGDIVLGAWLALQQPQPEDYILASGVPHTVAELAELAFAHVGLDYRDHIQIDDELRRGPEPTPRVGDPSRARARLHWQPTHDFDKLIARMVDADLLAMQAT
jgi:GDPmannose 4,6-dehydratase